MTLTPRTSMEAPEAGASDKRQRCYCPDDCRCHREPNPPCGCREHERAAAIEKERARLARAYDEGYAALVRGADALAPYRDSRNRAGIEGAKDAVRSWRRASTDHAETSYHGAHAIAHQRAFWLGVARAVIHRHLPQRRTR